ncbi:MAG: autotransporter domain-containing protein, partial [Planctomycetaceae bacterium]|nr:autotransporter domain-containing protein [Planctomycetaceae bacterium]
GGANADVNVRGSGILNLGSHLNIATGGVLNLNNSTSAAYTEGGMTLGGGSTNTGTININDTVLRLNGNVGGGGTIEISDQGMLYFNTQTVSQNITGNYNPAPTTASRGKIMTEYAGTTGINGNLSGSIAFDGGGTARINSVNNIQLSQLYVLGGTNVIISDQNNIDNTGVTLAGGGGLSRAANTPGGDLHITNDIMVGGASLGSTYGALNSLTSTIIPWNGNADSTYDAGRRFYIDGILASAFLGATMDINSSSSGYGTVVLTNNNSGFTGDYQIYHGVLEISEQRNLGITDYADDYGVYIGDSYTAPLERAAFRVVGNAGDTKTISHWMNLQTGNSFYEVFTKAAQLPITDADGNIIYYNEQGQIVADSTQGFPQYYSTDIWTMPDRDRFKVIQEGQIRGNGNLNKAGDGTLELNVHNSYTGDTIIWHGVLSISNANNINNAKNAFLYIGGVPLMEDNNFRPVFETHLASRSTGSIIINTGVVINATNSVVRTTGIDNETVFTNTITSDAISTSSMVIQPYEGALNKEGAGKLTLGGFGNWGFNGTGDLNIKQGTIQFSKAENLATGTITIGINKNSNPDPQNTMDTGAKDIERFDANNNPVIYKAILKLDDNAEVGIGNRIVLNSAQPATTDDPSEGSYIEVGTNSILTLNGVVAEGTTGSNNLNKIGKGELVLKGTKNTFTGWNNVYEGTLSVTSSNNIDSSKGVDLIGEGTIFDMTTAGANQLLNGLRGGTDPLYSTATVTPDNSEDWTRKILIGDNTLTLNIQNFKTGDSQNRNEFRGHIIGTGTVVKQGNSTFAAGFNGFNGTFDIQTGTLQTLTDTTLVGIKGKAGTYLDIRDNQLTINIGSNQQYDGTIISSDPNPGTYTKNTIRPEIVKDGAGTLTTSFYDQNIGSGVVQSFEGDLTIKQGNIVSTSDFHMQGGSNLTFYVNPDLLGSVSPNILDVSKHSAVFLPGGITGKETSTVHVYTGDNTTGWTTPSGTLTVGKILGNDKSDYTGLRAATTDSLYYTLGLQDIYGTSRHDLYVNLNVTGFGGVGNTFNTQAAGEYLDNARITDLTKTGLAPLIQELWAFGSNVTDSSALTSSASTLSRAERLVAVRGLLQQIAPDTIANGMFMGLDQPWRVAFDRLNLDSQMVYVAPPQGYPQQYRGQIIANMRNLWFTPTVQTVSARSDGNARKFGIDRPGYKLGFDKRVAQNTSVGFQLGYSSPKLREGDDRIEGSDFQVGLYGGSMVGNYIELKGFIGFGHQNFKSNRNVYVNLPGYSPQSLVAHGRYDGDTFNFSFDVSRPLFLGFAILRPTIGLDSEHAFRYAFTETGSPIAMKFERSSLSRTRARFGLSLETTTLDRAIFTGRLGYSALLGGHDYATASGVMVGTNVPAMSVRSVAVGKSFFEAGVGTKIFLNPVKTLALVGNYDATVANQWAEHQGLVGFTYIY